MEVTDADQLVLPLSMIRPVQDYPWLVALIIFVLVCTYTRIKTGSQAHFGEVRPNKGPRTVPLLPYWIPWLGHSIPFGIFFVDWLNKIFRKHRTGVIALRIAGGTHNVVVSPGLVKEIFTRPGLPVDMDGLIFYLLDNFFGDNGSTKALKHGPTGAEYWKEAHQPLYAMMREPFVGDATRAVAKTVSEQAWNLISGNESWVDQSGWERAGHVEVVLGVSKNGSGFVAEADLHKLTREWVGNVATDFMFGRSFLANNPGLLTDLWHTDSKFQTFLLGLPRIMVPGLTAAHYARSRVIDAIQEHHEAMCKIMADKDPGTRYDDMSDIPQMLWDRVRIHEKAGASYRTMAICNLTVLWALNVNANQVIFWLIFYVFSHKDILESIRAEIAPFVKLQKSEDTGLSLSEPPKLSIDVHALMNKSPLLKGAFFESMRLETASNAYRTITADFTITESEDDAKYLGKSHPETYLLRKGELVFVPGMIHQENSAYWPDPKKFEPRRFWTSSGQSEQDDRPAVEYKTLRSWGGGKTMCKGRNFAEREVLIFAAAVMTTWEIELADPKDYNVDGTWKHPGHHFAAGAGVPLKDIRVRMWRRIPSD